MKLEKWALIAEIVGAVAVVVSVLYVGIQVRENSATLEAASVQAVSDSLTEFTASVARDADASHIWNTGLQEGLDSLSAEELGRFNLLMVAMVRRMENVFFQHRQGFIPEEQWLGLQAGNDFILLSDGGQQWWANPGVRSLYSPSFGEFIDDRAQ